MKRFTLAISALLAVGVALAAIPNGYYDVLNGKKKEELKRAAKSLCVNHVVVEYGSGANKTWGAFEKTDVKTIDGVDYWWDMYSDELREVSKGTSGLNIEHAVANSWWGGTKNDAYKDLFHLNPSDATANNRKSNYPLGIVASVTWTNGVTTVGKPQSGTCGGANYVFEPLDEYKGDFARAFMYMFTTYTDVDWKVSMSDRNYMFDGTDWPTLQPWAYEMLLQWAANDPVSKKEIDRNEAIYAIQGIRNPFIDLPDLAEYIWGSKTNEAYNIEGAPIIPLDPDDPDNPAQPGTPAGDGTAESPYNVAAAVQLAIETGAETESAAVYVMGYVNKITEEPSEAYGTMSFTLADVLGGSEVFTCYRVKGLNNTFIDDADLLHVGDKVIVYGPVTYYNNKTPETKSGKAYIVSINGNTGEEENPTVSPDGTGTFDSPYNTGYVQATSEDEKGVWVEGYVVGYMNGGNMTSLKFEVPDAGSSYTNTNLALAADKDCTNVNICIPVALPNKNMATGENAREALGLKANPDIYGKHVKLYGNITNYFSTRGLKEVSNYSIINDFETDIVSAVVAERPFKVVDANGGIEVLVSEQVNHLTVYDLGGRPVYSRNVVSGVEYIALPKGVYIVTCDGNAIPFKLFVK